MNLPRFFAAGLLLALAACSSPPAATTKPAESAAPSAYAGLLAQYATPTGVRYAAWHANAADRAKLTEVVRFYETTTPPAGKKEALAWHLNAYNAAILDRILAKHPTDGPLAGDPLFFHGNAITISGQKTSFDHFEQKVIRPTFAEPRIHFALNCASVSCPPLAPEPFTAANLDAELDRLARAFINDNPQGVRVSADGRTVHLSRIFEWYAADFGGRDQLVAFANRFRTTPIPLDAKVEFFDYDWALNAAK